MRLNRFPALWLDCCEVLVLTGTGVTGTWKSWITLGLGGLGIGLSGWFLLRGGLRGMSKTRRGSKTAMDRLLRVRRNGIQMRLVGFDRTDGFILPIRLSVKVSVRDPLLEFV